MGLLGASGRLASFSTTFLAGELAVAVIGTTGLLAEWQDALRGSSTCYSEHGNLG